ncbi:hypothetical protein C882_2607 [Caenispirillum salinarum AK4]|uniref:Uncharacterized protein n=1 Tax=Caenispirillum salinarum AK4 TaxID=1238182 RepID=K9HQG8_9PROT|nr:hypothetical protein [Caenispirillum salinarum]EKV32528.1 hypothetical protein C882_2607 [Caenispirillum salinarum AK4]
MTYTAMTFFILAVLTGLFGFTSFEDGGEPGAAALARLLAVIFAASFAIAGAAVMYRRLRPDGTQGTRAGRAAAHGRAPGHGTFGGAFAGGQGSASERGSWDGSRRSATPRRAPGTASRRES